MRHRPGVTLVEVLVAIFIMGIGMLALLALFPLGAVSMAQALKDDRCASSALNAEAFAVANDVGHDFMVSGAGGGFSNAFGNPFGTVGTISSDLTQATGYTGPSNAVLVDPFGYLLDSNAQDQKNLGRVATSLGIPRRSICFSQNAVTRTNPLTRMTANEAARWCTMLDGITFVRGDNIGANAVPDTSQGSVIRDGRYTWGWLLRRPLWSSDNVINMSVIVFSGRPTTSLTGEVTCAVVAGTGIGASNSVTITYVGDKPSLRSGGWILDTTPLTVGAITNVGGSTPINVVYGTPYRVVNVTESGGTNLTLELQTPISPAVYPPWTLPATQVGKPYQMSLVTILENAVEVFDRGSFVQP
jgi:prepilin-type N-terminal cleavage/methylation domain-containing protein